ncbi:hypothetical protein QJQ45_025815 [Haematococcus lacustris]|nr:hypothetical protein QJQ45_025815 [Haematococcus lacustris]
MAHDGAKGSKPSVTQLPGATVARPSLVSQVALGHVGVHWVQVTAQLLGALLHDPLKIVVWRSQERHPHSSAAVASGPSNSNAVTTTAVGNVDVDLAPLLQQAADRKQAARWAEAVRSAFRRGLCRWLSGSHLLIDPGAKYFVGARIRVKALLELSPPSRPSSAILAASCWQPCESFTIHQKPHHSPPRTQPNATAVAQQEQEPAPESPGQAGQRHSPGPEMRPQPQHPAMLLCNQVPSPTPGQGDVPSTSSTARTPTPGNPSTPAAQQQSPALDTDDIAVCSVQAPGISTHPLRSGAQGSSSHGVQGGQPCSPEANSPSACADEELAAQLKAQLHELDIMQHQWQYRLQQPQLSPHHSPAQAETPGARRRGGAGGQQAAGPSAHDPWSWQWDISRQPLQPSSPPAAQLSPPALHAVAGRGLVSPPPMQQHAESLGSQAPALRVDSQLTVANVQGLAALSSKGRGVSGEGSMSGWADGLLVSTGGGGARMLHVGPGPGGEVSPQGMARLAAVQTCSDDGAGEGGCWGGASSSEADTDELLASIPVATQREEYCGPGRGSRAAADAPPTPSDSHSSGLGPASPAQPPPGSSSSLRGRGRAGQGALHPNEEWAFSVAKQGVGRLRASTAQHPAMLLSPSWSPSASHGTLAAEEDLPRSVPRSGEEAGCGETASVSGQQGPRPDQLGSAASDRDLGSGSALGAMAPGPDVQPAGSQGAAGWGGEAAAAVVVDAAGLQPGRGHAAVVGSLQARLDAMFEEFKQQVRGS